MMGGDYAPQQTLLGVDLFLADAAPDIQLLLIGDEEIMRQHFSVVPSNISFLHTSEVIDMHESPTRALRDKPNSSVSMGLQLLGNGMIEANHCNCNSKSTGWIWFDSGCRVTGRL